MLTLVLATHNAHKVAEIRTILSRRFRYLTLADFPNPPIIKEDASTFAGNAAKKSVQIANWLSTSPPLRGKFGINGTGQLGLAFVLADDSGLEVDVLNGAPGVHSARFAALDSSVSGNSPDHANNAKLLRLLKDVPLNKRTARFRCVIALTPLLSPSSRNASELCYADEADMQTDLFEGICEGTVAEAPSGSGGFGYDPLFVPTGCDRSFALLGEAVKNQISHRGRALVRVRQFLARFADHGNPTAGDQSSE